MRVLVIGSLAGDLGQAAQFAIARGARIDQADDVAGGVARLRRDARIDAVMCDIAHDIVGLVRTLADERIAVPVVACGTNEDTDGALRAIRGGAREFLPLPPDADLIAAILAAVAGESHPLIARDPLMRETVRRAEQVAASEASVLIAGESGTGKEVIARHIHARSRRASGPFVALNCAAVPESLLESELFGHEKGAFSGAVARRVGKFEAADSGTLLLDEITEMDVRLQAKLLRALQEREIDRLGGSAPVRVNVRILATTNRDLGEAVERGTFREDLYFRLNVVALNLPPLRKRPGDIGALAEHFARKYADLNGLPPRHLTPAAQQRLAAGAWRGNVRELENTIHRAVLLARGDAIDVDAIELGAPGSATPERPGSFGPLPAFSPRSAQGDPVAPLVGRRMEDVERDLILHTLGHTLGNRTHAATILGISIRALRNKLRDYAAQGAHVPPPPTGIAMPFTDLQLAV
ncbi:MAG TPA: sigma-54 dependent transcriptional regulator [Acetobacteraceae bacterium]|jgi:DNA-binding NtrC family response regulator|nr:sigma-54 dependent transcriptional regulator [Acetobacteraceae bacterium]